jgi:hypothetical protein
LIVLLRARGVAAGDRKSVDGDFGYDGGHKETVIGRVVSVNRGQIQLDIPLDQFGFRSGKSAIELQGLIDGQRLGQSVGPSFDPDIVVGRGGGDGLSDGRKGGATQARGDRRTRGKGSQICNTSASERAWLYSLAIEAALEPLSSQVPLLPITNGS